LHFGPAAALITGFIGCGLMVVLTCGIVEKPFAAPADGTGVGSTGEYVGVLIS